jgi:uncharacterized protein (DUF2252 family)
MAERGRTTHHEEAFGAWEPAEDRPDPLDVIAEDERGRVSELLPLRRSRMAESPFTFYRATASLFAMDQSHLPRSSLVAQLSGDAHLSNFGLYRAPDRALVFDLNDFDETLAGPVEWDVRRLAASIELAGRDRGFSDKDRRECVDDGTKAYVDGLAEFAAMHHVDLWYHRVTTDDITSHWGDDAPKEVNRQFEETAAKARGKDRIRALRKLTEVGDDGRRCFRGDLPNITPVRDLTGPGEGEAVHAFVEKALASYRSTLAPDRQMLLDRYRFVDAARRVGGVGSIGTRCWVLLLMGDSVDDPLILQVKEAGPSCLEPHLGACEHPEAGQRVVEGQRRMQASTDVFLGWETLADDDGLPHDYYFRQLWDGKGSFEVERSTPRSLEVYAKICGHSLARAHARTGDARELADALDDRKALSRAMCGFAARYADQVEADHAAFVAATTT